MSGFGSVEAAAVVAGPLGMDESARLRGKKPEEVAKEFEVLLVAQMISEMRKTIPESDLLTASPERKMLDGAYDQEVARSLVARGDFGVARQIVAELHSRGSSGAGAADSTAAATGPLGSKVASPLADAPRVTSAFGERTDPLTGEPAFHAGVDLAAPAGTEVRAVAAGTVVFSGERGRAGNLVEVRHADGTVSSYAHLDGRAVVQGQQVAAGALLGTVGQTGRTTGPHLHFGLERDGAAVDPAGLLQKVLGRPASGPAKAVEI